MCIRDRLYDVDSAATPNVRHYHTDQVGSTVALTDQAGAVIGRVEYSAYGMVSYREGDTNTPFLYNGSYGIMTDAESGLLNMRARYYHPWLGHFTSPDPVGFSGGLNWYAYASGNPINFADPSGFLTVIIVGYATSGNPFGHVAIATTGMGVHSFGTKTAQGSSLTNYISKQASYRDSTAFVILTTAEQEAAINDSFSGKTDENLQKYPDNCAGRTLDALKSAQISLPSATGLPLPATILNGLQNMSSNGNALAISIPQNTRLSPNVFQSYNPNPQKPKK